jgi:thiol:disulfide interchange protein DsbD
MKVKISPARRLDLSRVPTAHRRPELAGRTVIETGSLRSRLASIAVWLLMVMLTGLPTVSQAQTAGVPDVRLTAAWSADRVRPGDRILLAVILEMDAGLHINADIGQLKPISGFKPFATELKVLSGTAGFVSERPGYPRAHPVKFDFADEALMVFDGRVVIYLPIQVDDRFEAPELELTLQIAYQACGKDFCLLPEKVTRTVSRPAAERGAVVNPINEAVFAGVQAVRPADQAKPVRFDLFGWSFSLSATGLAGWVLILMTAALGGLLLNVTPCVLPMIPIKVMDLARASEDRRRMAVLGLATFAGMICFWVLLGLLIAFISDFTAANQLFQYPVFTIAVGGIIGIMGLGMFGAFSVRLPQVLYRFSPQQKRLSGSFCIGLLIAVLSTPCTAPFMGTAAAFAITRSWIATLATFASIGIGMATPYLLLAVFPGLVSRVPRSGPASETVKQVMGLLMLAAATYFIGIGIAVLTTSPPDPAGKGYWWPVMAFCAIAGAWLVFRGLTTVTGKKARTALAMLGVAIIGLSAWGGLQLTDKGPIDWMAYSEQRLQEVLSNDRVAVLVFTAEWCLNCKAIETRVFTDPAVIELLQKPSVAPLKADITGSNPAGKAKLRELGYLTIPLAVVLTPNGRVVFKKDFYTGDQLTRAVASVLQGNPAGSE